MDIVTIVLILVAFFVMFLMLTSGQRKRQLEKALTVLEKDKIKLMKSIEHVKISFYQKKLDEKEAQDKIFEYEEKLREVESKLVEIRDKPLMRTVKKQQAKSAQAEVIDVAQETEEIKRAEGVAFAHIGARAIVILFIVMIIIVMVITGFMSRAGPDGDNDGNDIVEFEIPLEASSATDGTYPGSTGAIRVSISNDNDKDLNDVIVSVTPPDGSGIRFTEGEIGVKKIEVLESGGNRELFFPLTTELTTEEGEYVIWVEAVNNQGLNAKTKAKLKVRWIIDDD